MGTYSTTTGADNLIGDLNDDTFIVTPDTLTAGDSLTGGGGVDVLDLQSAGDGVFNLAAVVIGGIAIVAFDPTAPGTITVNATADQVDDDGTDYVGLALLIANAGSTDVVNITLTAHRNLFGDNVVFQNWSDGVDLVNFIGSSGADHIRGTTVSDMISGNADVDWLEGLAGNDTIDGGAGADTLVGGEGNDRFVVDDANDVVTEDAGEGTDVIVATVSYTLAANVENMTLLGSGDINGTGNADANRITGNAGANTLLGMDGADILKGMDGADSLSGGNDADNLQGGAGADTIDGGAGADTMYGGAGDDTFYMDVSDIVIENSNEGADTIISSLTRTLVANVENLTLTGASSINGYGNGLDNVITGNSGANVINGYAGADTMIGGVGNDVYYVDNGLDVVTENAGEGSDTIYTSVSYTMSANVEAMTLTGAADISGVGNAEANFIAGNAGANTLSGADGNDILKAMDGADSLAGGNGADNLQGGAGADTIDGGAGADTMYGGTGDDVFYMDATDIVVENASEGTDTIISALTRTLMANVENLTLSGASAINGYGNGLDNLLTGNSAANILNGYAGVDTMIGGDGADIYYVDTSADVVTESAGQGSDTIYASVSYTMSANVEAMTLTGSGDLTGTGNADANLIVGNSGANTLSGNEGNDVLKGMDGVDSLAGGAGADNLQGGAGDDVLDGGAGADTMYGGAGDDVYFADASDIVSENANEGLDTVFSAVTKGLVANVENLTLTGSAAINGFGNGLDNVLIGNAGANILQGQDGADTLSGGAGIDALYGGAGADAFVFLTFGASDADTIVDFVHATDQVWLDGLGFTALGDAGALDASEFHVGTAAADANDFLVYDSATGRLYYDADGAGDGAQQLVAVLAGHPTLDASDILIV